MRRLLIALTCSGLAALPAVAAPPTSEALDRLIEEFGVARELETVQAATQAVFDLELAGLSELPPEQRELLRGAALESFAANALRLHMQESFRRNLAGEDVEELLRWLQTPLGQKVRRLQEGAALPRPGAGSQDAIAILQERVTPERLDRFDRLDRATSTSVGHYEVFVISTIGVVQALAELVGRDPEDAGEAMRKHLEERVGETYPSLKIQVGASFALMYEELFEEELESYITFTETPVAQRYYQAHLQALQDAFATAGSELRGRIREAEPPSQGPGA